MVSPEPRELCMVSPEPRNPGNYVWCPRNPGMHARGKSDDRVVPGKPPNNGVHETPAEVVEGRRSAKGNTMQATATRTQSRLDALIALDRVRESSVPDAQLERQTPEVRAVCGNSARTDLCVAREGVALPRHSGSGDIILN